MCRNHHDLLGTAVIESFPLRHAVWSAEKVRLHFPRNTRNMPVVRDSSSTNRTGENGLLCSEERHCPGFSLEGTCAVRFQEGHKANGMRSEAWDSCIAS